MKVTNIFGKTIYNHRRALFFWSIGIILIGLFYASIYPSIGNNPAFGAALANLPDTLKSFIGTSTFFQTPDGFVHGEYLSMVIPFILSIIAIIVAGSLLAREEEQGTMELLLARPVSRNRIVLEKIAGLAAIIASLTLFSWVGLWIGKLLVHEFSISLDKMALCVINAGLLALALGALTFLITSLKSSRGLATGLVGTYFVASYIVGMFGEQVSWLKHFSFLSLFDYYQSADILHGTLNPWNFVILGSIVVICYLLATIAFSHRDTGR